ncbi:hypothetical protein SDC9_210269 [bioreactor metagenome]|uniref:DUF1468 domain-containing protein n=1 Tax=bioreactor metagenome TaxID=1076179 RepID=A0A645JHE1_9ZZZZ
MVFLAFFSYLLYVAETSPSYTFEGVASMEFPAAIFILMLVLCAVKLVGNIVVMVKEKGPAQASIERIPLQIWLSLALIVGYAFLWHLIGFALSTLMFVTLESKILRPKTPWLKAGMVGLGTTVLMIFVFTYLFNVDFPEPLYELIVG